jgi:hypothetical protein
VRVLADDGNEADGSEVRVQADDCFSNEAENLRKIARLSELRSLLRRHRAEGIMDELLKVGVESRSDLVDHFTEKDIDALPVGPVQQSKLRAVLSSLASAKGKRFVEEKLRLTTYSRDNLERKIQETLWKVFFISLVTGILAATMMPLMVCIWVPLLASYLLYSEKGGDYSLLPRALFEEYKKCSEVKKYPA